MTRQEILDSLSKLPQGGITLKKIKSKKGKEYEYYFLQWRENGKQKSKILKNEEIETVKNQLETRKHLESLLAKEDVSYEHTIKFLTQIRTGYDLRSFVEPVKGLKKRDGFKNIEKYIYGDEYNRVFILYGLRRTGKTTLIKQIISEMKEEDFKKAAFIQVRPNDDIAKINKDLKQLENNGYRYIFIDEVTLLNDFIEGAALLSDIYAALGMKIVLSGTDSLGFWIAKSNELYDRCRFLHTTFIPYREFVNVLNINGIDNYIQYGGTMSISGSHYNDGAFYSERATDEYIDSAIAKNIQHSLKYYQYGGHFRHLGTLYENDELTNAINRVIEDINHKFTIEVLDREFKSSDLKISANNLRKDRQKPSTILDDIDIDSFNERLKKLLDIKNKDERNIDIDDVHIKEIKEYLFALDLIKEIDIFGIDGENSKRIVFTQPGLRYSQAISFIDSLSSDELFKSLSAYEKQRVNERILSEIKGRMIEDIVLLETKLAKPSKNVFKLQFADGEFDMVINDKETLETEIYEIKYSKEMVRDQSRHLRDEKKCSEAEFSYGKIIKKVVLYRGKTQKDEDIDYVNVEEYLMNLYVK